MRKYTLVFSVIAHAVAIAAVIIAPALATDELPEPRRATEFIIVNAVMPPPPAVPIQRAAATPSTNPIPIAEPDGVQPERPAEPPRIDDVASTVVGVSFGDPLGREADQIPLPPTPPRPKEPVPVGGIVQAPKRIAEVSPIYPPIALAARKGGLVILQAVIDEEGLVREVKVLRSDPLFDQSAMAAVKQWRFTKPTLNGQPIPVVMTVTVTFSPVP